MAINRGIKGMTEEELRLYRLQQARLANQPTYYDKDVGFIEGLLGKTSIEEQHRLMGNRYPAPKLSLWDGIKQDLSTAWNNDNSAFKAEQWADQAVRAQEGKHAANAMAAKYNAQNNYGDEDANFDANGGYKMGYMGDGNMMPGGPTSTTFVEDETKGVINTTANAFDSFKKYFRDFDSPSKGVCTLPSGLQTQQLDRAACDAAGGTFNSPQMISDANAQSEKWYNKNYMGTSGFGIPIGAMKTGIQQLNHMRDAISNAQINDNKMQRAGLDWTPDKIAWIEKYGIDNLPGTLRDDTGGDTKETAVGRDTTGYLQEGLLSDLPPSADGQIQSQLQLRYPDRYADNAAVNQSIWDREVNIAEGRTDDIASLNFLEEQAKLQADKEKQALALQQGTDLRIDRRMGADSRAPEDTRLAQERAQQEAGIWADKAIDAEEQRIAGDWANQQIDKQERMAAIQAGIDEDATRTTQENYELAAGIEYDGNLTPNIILDSVTEAMEGNDEESKEKASILATWIKEASESTYLVDTAKKWGNIVVTALGLTDNDEKEDLTEEEIEIIIDAEDELTPPEGSSNTNTNVVPGVLSDSTTTTTTTTNTNGVSGVLGDVTSPKVTNTNVFNATASSTEGFTMDRLKNPLSPENKAWWLGGGGGVPGNNRAKEFFETLAYIGTPLKYRPSKTPGQQNIENRIANNNNIMDYAASQATSAPTFASLRAAVPSHQVIEDTIRGKVENDSDKGLFFGMIGGDSADDIDNMIAEKATIIREKMLQMTLINGTIPSIQQAIDALSDKPTTTTPPPPPGEGDGVFAKGVDFFSGLF